MKEPASGISNLIARIKADGVEAGERERQARLDAAAREAEQMIAQARAEAERIVTAAKEESERRKRQLDAELRMAARDFVLGLHERLSTQVIAPATADVVQAALADDQAIAELVVAVLGERVQGAQLTLDADRRTALEAAILRRIDDRAAAGAIEITGEAGLGGFRLTREGDAFAWDMSHDAIARELARLVEPSLRAALAPKPPQG